MKTVLQKHWKLVVGGILGVFVIGGIGAWIGSASSPSENKTEEGSEDFGEAYTQAIIDLNNIPKQSEFSLGFKERVLAFYDFDNVTAVALNYGASISEGAITPAESLPLVPPGDNAFLIQSKDIFTPEMTEEIFDLELSSYTQLNTLWQYGEPEMQSIILACKESQSNLYFAQGACVTTLIYKTLGLQP